MLKQYCKIALRSEWPLPRRLVLVVMLCGDYLARLLSKPFGNMKDVLPMPSSDPQPAPLPLAMPDANVLQLKALPRRAAG